MLFYYFTSSEYGLSNLKNRHLKVSRFNSLNDPFELLGIDMSDRSVRNILRYDKSILAEKKGLLCFSENKYDPVQWAHYAENYKGVCLGFEIPEKSLKKIKYVSSRLAISTLEDKDKQEKLLTTKFKHWGYEEERRLVVDLAGRPITNGLIFERFTSDIVLKEIYIGCRSELTFDDIKSVYSSEGDKVIIKYTRPAFKDFKIVWDQSKKSEHA